MVNWWIEAIAVIANIVYAGRWFFQMKASHEAGRSVNPLSFWILSIVGGSIMMVYAFLLGSVVLPLTIFIGTGIQLYNVKLELDRREKK